MSLPTNRPLSNIDIERYAKHVKIPNFRGVFMRNTLPHKSWKNEAAIVNMDRAEGMGTHWTAYIKRGDTVYYYDSFGNLKPPKEIVSYFKNCIIYYNHDSYQTYDTFNCGNLALKFLLENQ